MQLSIKKFQFSYVVEYEKDNNNYTSGNFETKRKTEGKKSDIINRTAMEI